MKAAAKFSEQEMKAHHDAARSATHRGGLSNTMNNGGGTPPVPHFSPGDTAAAMHQGRTKTNVPLPTGKVKDTMRQ